VKNVQKLRKNEDFTLLTVNYEGELKIIRNIGMVHVVQLVTLLVGHDAIRVVYLSPTVVVQM
jgi:hypothetical protein